MQKISCGLSWWHSSTIQNKKTINSKRMMEISEKPLIIKNKLLNKKFVKRIIIYPEQGDLQTSVFKSIYDADVILNLGTGSQQYFVVKADLIFLIILEYFQKKGKYP